MRSNNNRDEVASPLLKLYTAPMPPSSSEFLRAVQQILGADAVDSSESALTRYGRNRLPEGDRRPSGVVYPRSAAEVQTIVQLANESKTSLYSTSTGENSGLGLKSPVQPGCVIVDVGAHMKRILAIDETLCFAEIEPGVTYQNLYDELGRRGHKLMLDTTSGSPDGGIVGNTLDKGAGYTPYFDHFGMSCGLEVVLGDGRLLRTADGASPGAKTWTSPNMAMARIWMDYSCSPTSGSSPGSVYGSCHARPRFEPFFACSRMTKIWATSLN